MKEKKSILTNGLFQSIVSAIICILLGLLVGYLVLLAINPAGAGKAIQAIDGADEVSRQHARQDGAASYVRAVDQLLL